MNDSITVSQRDDGWWVIRVDDCEKSAWPTEQAAWQIVRLFAG
jgi:hypothetical protein